MGKFYQYVANDCYFTLREHLHFSTRIAPVVLLSYKEDCQLNYIHFDSSPA